MDVSSLLSATLSPTQQEREQATLSLTQFLSSNPRQYLTSLSSALASAGTPSHLRNAAGLAIKNALSARELPRQEEYAQRWKQQLDQQTRDQLKQEALTTLASEDRGARNVSGQVVAAIAAIELPAGMWNGLIPSLLELVGRQDNSGLRQATLQAIGFICESIVSPRLLRPLAATRNADRNARRAMHLRNPRYSRRSPTKFSLQWCKELGKRSPGELARRSTLSNCELTISLRLRTVPTFSWPPSTLSTTRWNLSKKTLLERYGLHLLE